MSSFWDDWFKRYKERRGFFFPEIDRMIEEMEKEMSKSFREMENLMPRDMVRVRKLPDGSIRREYGPFVYGYSVRIGPDGKPIVREFGNIKPGIPGEGRPPLNLQDQREPLVDIIEEDEEIRVITELPGVDKENIKLFVSENSVTISVETKERKYYKELELPTDVDDTTAISKLKNGILETILKKKRRRDKGTQIRIE
jgi:HSP20 family protein